MSGSGSEYRSIDEAAKFFGVSDVTMRRWIQDGCPVVEHGGNGVPYKLDLRAIHDWRQGRIAADAEDKRSKAERDAQLKLELLGGDALTVAGEKAQLSPRERAEALAAEINATKLAELRGELVRVAPLEADLTQAWREFRDRLLALPDELARELSLSKAQTDALQDRLEDALNDLADRQMEASRQAAGTSLTLAA